MKARTLGYCENLAEVSTLSLHGSRKSSLLSFLFLCSTLKILQRIQLFLVEARWCSGQAWRALDPLTRVRISPGLPSLKHEFIPFSFWISRISLSICCVCATISVSEVTCKDPRKNRGVGRIGSFSKNKMILCCMQQCISVVKLARECEHTPCAIKKRAPVFT
jgi:hypothetical protein